MLRMEKGFKLSDGRVLNEREMYNVYEYYRIAATEEYLTDNYLNSEDELLNIAIETRYIMDKYEGNGNPITEDNAIKEACEELNIKLIERD